jgi:hypothetical protein
MSTETTATRATPLYYALLRATPLCVGVEHKVRVSVGGTMGEHLDAIVAAAELQSYSRFQRTLMTRYGAFFRDEGTERSPRPKQAWADELEQAFASVPPAVPPTEAAP